MQTAVAQVHPNRDRHKGGRLGEKRNIASSSSRGRNTRARDGASDDDISENDDISEDNDGLRDSDYDDDDVDDSLSTKSSRIHQQRGGRQSSSRNARRGRDSSRPRSTVRVLCFFYT